MHENRTTTKFSWNPPIQPPTIQPHDFFLATFLFMPHHYCTQVTCTLKIINSTFCVRKQTILLGPARKIFYLLFNFKQIKTERTHFLCIPKSTKESSTFSIEPGFRISD